MKIFKTKIAVTNDKVVEENNFLEEIGVKSSIDDEDIKWVNAWIPFDRIVYVEESFCENEFIVTLINNTILTCKDNPFEKFQ